jgi:hypothetical protein
MILHQQTEELQMSLHQMSLPSPQNFQKRVPNLLKVMLPKRLKSL